MKYAHITRESIVSLVDTFYLRIRQTPELKEIFEAQIGTSGDDWRPHLERMYSFWATVLLGEGSFHGNPMAVHRNVPPFPEELFSRWLAVFRDTAQDLFETEPAELLEKRAELIAGSLRRGIYGRRSIERKNQANR